MSASFYNKLDRQIPPFQEARKQFEYNYVTHLLYLTDGNVTKAAQIAGKERKDFYDLMKRAGVDHLRYKKRNKDNDS